MTKTSGHCDNISREAILVSQQRYPDQNTAEPSRIEASDQGQAAKAVQNRETETRQQIVRALQDLGGEFCTVWPDFVRTFFSEPCEQTVFSDCALPPPFQPPEFDRLNQSPEDWAKAANAAWQQDRDRFLQSCDAWVAGGVDEEIPAAKQVRGSGIKLGGGRRNNTALERRHAWAAKYLLHVPLNKIAEQDNADATTVGRVAYATLRQANWLELAKAEKRAARR